MTAAASIQPFGASPGETLDLVVGNDTPAEVAGTTLAILVVAATARWVIGRIVRHRFDDDPWRRYWAPRLITYVVTTVAIVGLIIVWAPLGGRLTTIIGFAAAGLAFAMQEVIGAAFGWINILAGRIYTVGDRISVGTVQGDVIDISPLRTKVMEIGGDPDLVGSDRASWVQARQPTGRVVTFSNRMTFSQPVFNYSAQLEFIWEELVVAVPQGSDWKAAERIVLEQVRAHDPAVRERGERVLSELGRRYLVSRADVEPQTFVRIADGDIEILGRFVVAVRSARRAKDAMTRAILEAFAEHELRIAYMTYGVEQAERGPSVQYPANHA
ncbi:MAG: mechanosensitive ion channel family protein [Solirubrobacterales bacterium]